jgi:Protein of unknown function (DUF1553)/Protein of unknown function (DUF1549)/Planctomycete cytochrome C
MALPINNPNACFRPVSGRSARRVRLPTSLLIGLLTFARPAFAAGAAPDFARDIRPILEASCLKCHDAETAKSGLKLDTRSHALAGGDDGVDIVPGAAAQSRLIKRVEGADAEKRMPPKGKGDPLTPAQVALLRAWIDAGAGWDRDDSKNAAGTTTDGRRDWWSLKPLRRPEVPGTSGSIRNPIDAFVLATLNAKGLQPLPDTDRRTLIRRIYFDLTGLPPSPDAVAAFVADRDPLAYEKLVDRLLDSPAYGERWARHWLDVVHYGETHGYDKDKPRTHAWPYRDYVIRSLNADKPYGRFVREQIAGDVLYPGTRDGFEALGFIAAGPWDFIGHEEVPESKIDGRIARHLDRDDMVVNTMQTFTSLTVQCAQCHNHKFDPISQEDYYSLQAVFAAVDRADKAYDIDPDVARTRQALNARAANLTEITNTLNAAITARAGAALKEIDEAIAVALKTVENGQAYGYHSTIETKQDVAKWVQVDLGAVVRLEKIVLHPCKDDFNGIGEGFGFPLRYKVEVSESPTFDPQAAAVGDFSRDDVPPPKLKAASIDTAGRRARYVRVTATKLAPRQDDYIFALAELEAVDVDGRNAAAGAKVEALDSIEAPTRWAKANLTDGWYPGMDASKSARLGELRATRAGILEANTTASEREALVKATTGLAGIRAEIAKLPAQSTVYVAAVHKGSGAFAGTGANGGKPREIRILSRGNVLKPGNEAKPGTLSCVEGLPARFELAEGAPEGARRAALAEWLTRAENPLAWRSIVNRVWQYHFGRGLVETPNDFGRMGAQPTHPELLDWLAFEFRDGGQSLKTLHKLIVTSATYRRTSAPPKDSAGVVAYRKAEEADADNRFLWRQNRRKLEAEALRDAVLSVAGRLNPTLGGPSFQDFVVEHPEHSPHYEYALHDPEDPASQRRSIYRFIVRSQQQPFMTVLDCADPSMLVGKRNESHSPLQALSLLNNDLMLSMSRHFAEKLAAVGDGLDGEVRRACLDALGRAPTDAEAAALTNFARDNGLPNLCRLLFNLNEFAFVD